MWVDFYEKQVDEAKGDSYTLCSIINEASDDKQVSNEEFNALYEKAVNNGL